MGAFTERSLTQLRSCHPDLQRVLLEVVKHFDCTVIQGARTVEQQLEYMARGRSKVVNPLSSKHVVHAGRTVALAVDVAPAPIDWNDSPRFHYFAGFVMGTAQQLGVPLRWGGDWNRDQQVKDERFRDLLHFEIWS